MRYLYYFFEKKIENKSQFMGSFCGEVSFSGLELFDGVEKHKGHGTKETMHLMYNSSSKPI